MQIAKMFPIMYTIRALEHKIQTGVCRSCKSQQATADIDRTALAEARRQLVECADEQARLVKEAAGLLQSRAMPKGSRRRTRWGHSTRPSSNVATIPSPINISAKIEMSLLTNLIGSGEVFASTLLLFAADLFGTENALAEAVQNELREIAEQEKWM